MERLFAMCRPKQESGIPVEAEIAVATGINASMSGECLAAGIAPEAGVQAQFDAENISLLRDISAGVGISAEFDPLHLVGNIPLATGIRAGFVRVVESARSIGPCAGMSALFDGFKAAGDVWPSAGVHTAFEGVSGAGSLAPSFGLHVAMDYNCEYARTATAACGMTVDFDGFNWNYFLRMYRDRIVIRYRLTLSDGIHDDIDIPISSFQGRFRTVDPTFLSVVIPGNDQYAEISERADGAITMTMEYTIAGTVYHSEQICTVDVEEVRLDEGASSVSVTLSGHRSVTHIPKITHLTGGSYKAVYAGKLHYRCAPDLFLRPGDTCVIGADSFIAGSVTWSVNPSGVTMEIAEAD